MKDMTVKDLHDQPSSSSGDLLTITSLLYDTDREAGEWDEHILGFDYSSPWGGYRSRDVKVKKLRSSLTSSQSSTRARPFQVH
jgi:hypothetical protein